VDWFRFWLQGYEDPHPAKADQYARCRELRKLQEVNEQKAITPEPARTECPSTTLQNVPHLLDSKAMSFRRSAILPMVLSSHRQLILRWLD